MIFCTELVNSTYYWDIFCLQISIMDPDLYDEFGNYIGPELESEDESESEEERDEEDQEQKDEGMEQEEEEEGSNTMAIVLHEVSDG